MKKSNQRICFSIGKKYAGIDLSVYQETGIHEVCKRKQKIVWSANGGWC